MSMTLLCCISCQHWSRSGVSIVVFEQVNADLECNLFKMIKTSMQTLLYLKLCLCPFSCCDCSFDKKFSKVKLKNLKSFKSEWSIPSMSSFLKCLLNSSSHRRCSLRKGVLRPEACNFIKKETLTKLFSCEFCEISKDIFFTEHLWVTASDPTSSLIRYFPKCSPIFFFLIFCLFVCFWNVEETPTKFKVALKWRN